jgi:GNAT superfamily N-acetyltransferase
MLAIVSIRDRRPQDTAVLAGIVDRLATQGYPPHRPSDVAGFVASANDIGAFVYEHEGEVVGHVALKRYAARPVMVLASDELGMPVEGLSAVARIFVSPSTQRRGIASSLLGRAVECAHDVGLRPILDVWQGLPSAISLYESAGWLQLGSTTIEFRSACTSVCVHDGTSISSFVYAGPAPRI